MSYITTITGKHFDPIEPDRALIDLYDIAHSLSMICRGNGHTKIFYSVAQHCISCALEAQARGLSREIILGCLLHDASEAYLSDVTRPVKKDLPYYLKVEEKLQNMLWEHFIGRQLTEEEQKQIFAVDDQILSAEFQQIMYRPMNEEYKLLVRELRCEFEMPELVREKFLGLYEKYHREF